MNIEVSSHKLIKNKIGLLNLSKNWAIFRALVKLWAALALIIFFGHVAFIFNHGKRESSSSIKNISTNYPEELSKIILFD